MGWASGFRAGSELVRNAMELRDKRELREGLSKLQEERDATLEAQKAQALQEQQLTQQGVPLSSQVANPDGLPTMLGATPVAAGNMSPVAPQGGVPLGQLQAVQFTQAAENLPTMSEAEYLRKQADVYTRFGKDDRAAAIRGELRGLTRQELLDQRYEADRDEDRRRYDAEQEAAAQAKADTAAFRANQLKYQQTVADKQLAATNNRIKIDSQNEATRLAQTAGSSIYQNTIMNGGSLNDVYAAVGEQFPQRLEDGSVNPQYSAAMAVANKQAIEDSGLDAQGIGSINSSVINTIDNALSFEGDETQRIERLNEAAAVVFDSDPYDNVTPRIVRASDLPSGYGPIDSGYVILEGDRLVDSFDSLDEISKMGESFKEQLNNNPVNYAVLFAEQKQRSLTASLANAKDQAARQKAYFSFLEKNPTMVGTDKMREIEKLYRVGQPLDNKGRFGGGTSPSTNNQPKGLFSTTDTKLEQEAAEAQLLAERQAVYTPEVYERISDPRTVISDLETIANDPAAPEEFRTLAENILSDRRRESAMRNLVNSRL